MRARRWNTNNENQVPQARHNLAQHGAETGVPDSPVCWANWGGEAECWVEWEKNLSPFRDGTVLTQTPWRRAEAHPAQFRLEKLLTQKIKDAIGEFDGLLEGRQMSTLRNHIQPRTGDEALHESPVSERNHLILLSPDQQDRHA